MSDAFAVVGFVFFLFFFGRFERVGLEFEGYAFMTKKKKRNKIHFFFFNPIFGVPVVAMLDREVVGAPEEGVCGGAWFRL